MAKAVIQTYYDYLPNHWYYRRVVKYTEEINIKPKGCKFWLLEDLKEYEITYADVARNDEIRNIFRNDSRRLTNAEMEKIVNYYLANKAC